MCRWGNARANKYWEHSLPADFVPDENKVESFIRSKYEYKKFVRPGPMPEPEALDGGETTAAPAPVAAPVAAQAPVVRFGWRVVVTVLKGGTHCIVSMLNSNRREGHRPRWQLHQLRRLPGPVLIVPRSLLLLLRLLPTSSVPSTWLPRRRNNSNNNNSYLLLLPLFPWQLPR